MRSARSFFGQKYVFFASTLHVSLRLAGVLREHPAGVTLHLAVCVVQHVTSEMLGVSVLDKAQPPSEVLALARFSTRNPAVSRGSSDYQLGKTIPR